MNRRDIELLSAYLDGQLSSTDSARLETRLKSESDLVAVMDDLRATRNLLRRLPQRRAPRNFTLTPQMVGKNPPLPRSYSFFRYVTALATLLLFFSFGLNFLVPQMQASEPLGMGGGGGADLYNESTSAADSGPAATEAAATEPPMFAQAVPAPTQTAPETTQKIAPSDFAGARGQADGVAESIPVPVRWQVALALAAAIGALLMFMMQQAARRRWQTTR